MARPPGYLRPLDRTPSIGSTDLSPSERGITGRDLRQPFLHHRRDERAVAREHAAARDRTAARARRHVLRVEQPLVAAKRSMNHMPWLRLACCAFGLIHDTPCG